MSVIEKVCDLCSSPHHDIIYSYPKKIKAKEKILLEWTVNNVVCRQCGFAFVTPVPTQDIFYEYFMNKTSIFKGSHIDYSIEKRMVAIQKYQTLSQGKTVLEIGSNNCSEFIQALSTVFDEIHTVEANENCKSTYKDIQELPENSADLIISYLVVDNFVYPQQFLEKCSQTVKSKGYVLLEVPHLYLYPKYLSGLFSFEHLSHFSPLTLSLLAKKSGLELVEISQEYSSRPFGFLAVFKKGDPDPLAAQYSSFVERKIATSCITEARDKILKFKENLMKVRKKIEQKTIENKKVFIWGVNDVCEMLLEDYSLDSNCILVDSDPQKKNMFSKILVQLPEDSILHIKNSELFILNTPRHKDEIFSWILEKTGRRFQSNEVQYLSIH